MKCRSLLRSMTRSVPGLSVLTLVSLSLIGCSDDVTEIFQIADCGLERLDLTGTWTVAFTDDTSTLFNCNGVGPAPPTVTVGPPSFVFNDISVFASAANVGFRFEDSANLLDGNVEADSCLMLISLFDQDESQFLQCFGTFDRPSGVMLGGCDSTAVVDPLNTSTVLADCDLNPILGVTVTITP